MVSYRNGRINEEIKKDVSNTIQNKIKDPRLSAMVSVTKVDTTKDLSYTKIYVSIFGDKNAKKETLQALKSSTSLIRKEIGSHVKLRHVPQVIIEVDETIERAIHLEGIFNQIKEKTKNDEDINEEDGNEKDNNED
ncbi:30S ribosome-binding factor RbfA [Clostridium sp. CM028]|uniref:30S ribosome-binding factor RbfA n=1 Tax=unclassified Clostridium TaxID=2614128 RepID=UPI001C0B725C|nr:MULTISPECIES: 30S ribosome-binding factor RbfA [unclassified Clostridium]MBU3092255.1 30S ribosome-binding factor RbfA [Clostridium sp. CF011]MBW9144072.1 30S ribosome-binding factor RbfA [Clostridium sp. CM027]MBW9147617.1 30S ribosome-binding factor RbfA [Clostridium sp. CM028]UVE41279.1 30S ribosome-binding factor RbfA [Clostridium sp. CM027]WAG70275.1 30S ribosome-binding factor RbfA [Clostridium sp. CF011]